ncbi:hypothetical protein LEP1GSC008_1542 [Leptospira kirschneri serovar Bulgarica str. Nikolaevo]|uniref:Uncharacterized protein n=1 Tax=Leptospira kirschneri serovar Bulgarica str. Nikolaevo TaxID=1240687 RepID=M6FHN6_9LEPT|nr:hypothetical protein LEP1GSC008_1542 [Leptospira kirschneri serovar Bulgarica str. Nikolaevo]
MFQSTSSLIRERNKSLGCPWRVIDKFQSTSSLIRERNTAGFRDLRLTLGFNPLPL